MKKILIVAGCIVLIIFGIKFYDARRPEVIAAQKMRADIRRYDDSTQRESKRIFDSLELVEDYTDVMSKEDRTRYVVRLQNASAISRDGRDTVKSRLLVLDQAEKKAKKAMIWPALNNSIFE